MLEIRQGSTDGKPSIIFEMDKDTAWELAKRVAGFIGAEDELDFIKEEIYG